MNAIKLMTFAIFSMLLISSFVLAEEGTEVEIEDAGTTPGSVFHGLDRAMERINLALTFNKVKRAEKALRIAEERLAELNALAENNESEYIEKSRLYHERSLERVRAAIEGMESNGDEDKARNALERITALEDRILDHQEKVSAIKARILERQGDRMSEEQIVHLEEIFVRMENRTFDLEVNLIKKKDNVRLKYKVISEKTDEEIEELLENFEEREGFKEHKLIRAKREIARANIALDLFEKRVHENNVTEFDEQINEMRDKIAEAKLAFEAGDYKQAKKISYEVKQFGEEVNSKAIKLYKAKKEGKFEKTLNELRDKTIEKRAKALDKIQKFAGEEIREALKDARGGIEEASEKIEEASADGVDTIRAEAFLSKAKNHLDKAEQFVGEKRFVPAVQFAKQSKRFSNMAIKLLDKDLDDDFGNDLDDDLDDDLNQDNSDDVLSKDFSNVSASSLNVVA